MAASGGGGGGGDSLGISRRLASCDKQVRDKAIHLLAKWLECRDSVDEADLKKIWKGLFYCYWHTDKLVVQTDLASKLAELVVKLNPGTSVSYFDMFMVTIRREWGGIDHLRLNKFYLLMRKFLGAMFKAVLDQRERFDIALVARYMDSLRKRVLLADDLRPSLGVCLHLADIYIEELRPFLPIPAKVLEELIQPFEAVLTRSSDKTLLKRVRESVFYVLLSEASSEEGSELGSIVRALEFDDRFFRLAAAADTPQANRRVLYWLQAEFKKLKRLPAPDKRKDVDNDKAGSVEQMDTESSSRPAKKKKAAVAVIGKVTANGSASQSAKNMKKKIAVPAASTSSSSSTSLAESSNKKKTAVASAPESSKKKKNAKVSPLGKRKTSPNATGGGSSATDESAKKKKKMAEVVFDQPFVSNLESRFHIAAGEVPPLETVLSPLIVGKKSRNRKSKEVVVSGPLVELIAPSAEKKGRNKRSKNQNGSPRVASPLSPEQVQVTPVSTKRKHIPVSPLNTASKKWKSSPAEETPGATPSTVDASTASNKKKKVRFALKRNTIWTPRSPSAAVPARHKLMSPSHTPKGSALKRTV